MEHDEDSETDTADEFEDAVEAMLNEVPVELGSRDTYQDGSAAAKIDDLLKETHLKDDDDAWVNHPKETDPIFSHVHKGSPCKRQEERTRKRPQEVNDPAYPYAPSVANTKLHERLNAQEGEEPTGSDTESDTEVSGREKQTTLSSEEEAYQAELAAESDLTEEELCERRDRAQTSKQTGNDLFRSAMYADAQESYTSALALCPHAYPKDRSILYSNRAACYMHMENKEEAIADCTRALDLNTNYLKARVRRAELYEATDKLDESLRDWQQAVEADPGMWAAREAVSRLPGKIEQRNEKMKAEMMGKLRELGDMVLRPFGLSTNNFSLQQDANTGGYSVSFNQGTPPAPPASAQDPQPPDGHT